MPGMARSSSARDYFEFEHNGLTPAVEKGRTSKRPRLAVDALVSPRERIDDSYALTPSQTLQAGRRQRQDGTAITALQTHHRPGQIVRITMKDFVTYSHATFLPGPTLNMVIGPNGTGKSTLVCAICLGLGWGPQHLGRASNVSEFVKKGRPEADIEVELQGPKGGPNSIIRRIIKAENNKSTWFIDGEQSNNKRVLEQARSFDIQVDNLCHFLPQDRVVEFSRLEPIERLSSTLQAAAEPRIIDCYNKLKLKRDEQRRLEKDLGSLQDQLKNLQRRQEAQRQDVERLRERSELKRHIVLLEKIRPMAEFHSKKNELQEIKSQRDKLMHEIKLLKRENGPAMLACNEKEAYRNAISAAKLKREDFATKFENYISRMETERKIKDRDKAALDHDKEIAKKEEKKILKDIATNRIALRRLGEEMSHEPPDFNPAEYNEKIREREREINRLNSEAAELQEAGNEAAGHQADLNARIRRMQDQIDTMQSKAGQQMEKLKKWSSDTYRAWEWIQENQDRFKSQIHGPPLVVCSIKDMRHADTIESLLQRSESVAITCTNYADFQALQNQLYGVMKLHDITLRQQVENMDHASNRPPLSADISRQLGINSWIIDYLEGPSHVLAMLCAEARLHATAIIHGAISVDHYQRLERTENLPGWVANNTIYKVVRRREYNAASVSSKPVQPARYWTDQAIDGTAINEKKDDISCMEGEIEKIQGEQATRQESRQKKRSSTEQLIKEKQEIEEEKADRQRELSSFRTLPARIETIKKSLEAGAAAAKDNEQAVRGIYRKVNDLMVARGQLTMNIIKQVDLWRQASEQVVIAKIALAEAETEQAVFQQRLEAAQAGLRDKVKAQDILAQKVETTRKSLKDVHKVIDKLRNDDPAVQEFFSELDEELKQRSPNDLEAEIDSQRARLELLAGGNESAITEWEERGRRIEIMQNRVSDLEASLTNLQRELDLLRGVFEPAVDTLVERISTAFAASFERINCAGSVDVHKHGENGADFDNWAINILVSFRTGENMSVLDSHRQSGGERAVSTIFYLMALQSLSRAPFRVVDEINQGMDPRNERIVHERLVSIACGEEESQTVPTSDTHLVGLQTSQYFLVTPKLLTGLHYSRLMKVHCIASGQHMPDDARMVDFRALVSTRRAQSGQTLPNGSKSVSPPTLHVGAA